MDGARIPVVCLVGPTGAGKTAASLHLAEKFNGAVVNCDSRQVYKDFPIITAQPSVQEREACPHYLYGFLDTREKISAGIFSEKAARAIADIHQAGGLPLLVGGTGMYLEVLLEGIAAIPPIPDAIVEKWRCRCLAEGAPALHRLLMGQDPHTAARLHPNDSQRIARALEVFEATGHTLAWWHARPRSPSPYHAIKIAVRATLDALTPQLAARIEQMLALGALEEARQAMQSCNDRQAPGWSGIGCAELYAYLKGEMGFEECKRAWLLNTRRYAKRQLTWFRRDSRLHWVDGGDMATMNALVHSVMGVCG